MYGEREILGVHYCQRHGHLYSQDKTNRQMAGEIMEANKLEFVGNSPELSIDVWSVDNDNREQGVNIFFACVDSDGNEVKHKYVESNGQIRKQGYRGKSYADPKFGKDFEVIGLFFVGESPISPTHALKLAVEKRQEWLQNGSPIPKEAYHLHSRKEFAFLKELA